MMEEELVVEIFHHILNQISDNIIDDCCDIIEKLFESVQCNETLSINKTLCSVKLLLNLYEKMHSSSNAGTKSTFPAEKIFQAIKYFSNKTFFDKSAQNELLSIVSVLYKISVTCKIPNLTELLSVFYNDVFREIILISKQKDYDSERVMLLLKILCTLYGSQFCEKNMTARLKQANGGVDASLQFALLALRGDENIALQTSFVLIPEFMKLFKTNAPLLHIWSEFSKCNSHNYSRIFLILCNFISNNFLTDEMNLVEFLVGRENYWELIQCGVLKRDITIRKQAMYLFKKTIDVLRRKQGSKGAIESADFLSSSTVYTREGNANCHWEPNRRDELIIIYSDIIIILEYLNEEQVHIVGPIFEMIENVIEKIIRRDLINFSWIFLIYEILMMHESTEVTKWGIKSLLKMSGKVFLDEAAVKKTAILLSSSLNNISLYYNNGFDITDALGAFFENIVQLNTADLFFKTFIKEVCKLAWCPEALFFVTTSFSRPREYKPFWGPEEVAEIRMFVSKAFKTLNKTIRRGIQCEILNAVTALTQGGKIPLEDMMLLISKFSTSEIFRTGYQTRKRIITYLKNGYSKEDAQRVLNLFLNSSQCNEKCAALSINLFLGAFEDDFAWETFLGLLSSFKNSHRRPYCDVPILNRYLLTISHIIEECVQGGEHPNLIALVLQFFEDLVVYIHSQIRAILSLKDFSTCRLYLKAFENLIKLLNPTRAECDFEDLFKRLYESLESNFCCKQELSSAQTYSVMRLIKAIYESGSYKLEPVCLDGYILQHLNKPLRKEENTEDVHMMWGKMNSEFFEAKWVILENLIRNGKIRVTVDACTEMNSIRDKDLFKMCIDVLDVGGYGVLRPVMHILAGILPLMKDVAKFESVVDSLWSIALERRKADDYKLCVESFVKMLFHKELFSRREDILQVLIKYIDLMFSDSSLVTVDTLVRHAEKLELSHDSMPVLCRILAKGILFGPFQKKDVKLTAQVCSYVNSLRNCPEGENVTSSSIRARAVVKLLTIRNEKGVAKSVMDVLIQMESEISKKRKRYFGNCFIHLKKTRLMQGVLVLLDSFEKEERDKVVEWVYSSLMSESPQPSVRHLQEWCLSLLYESFSFSSCALNWFENTVKKTPRAWCSVIMITYLLVQASLCEIDEAIQHILPFCMDHHFEARLYAEVIIVKLYRLAQRLNLEEVLQKWRFVHSCIEKNLSRAEGNAAKNYAKLEKHFFLNGFGIRAHYSLKTIYWDLPRLTNVASDEWISSEIFDSISISGAHELGFNLSNPGVTYWLNNSEWLLGKSEEFTMSDEKAGEVLENYQKKMIPTKSLTVGCSEESGDVDSLTSEKEGLIVVASLIDRIPNLGGLARTCEVFGASQLVLNTTRCIEDKDFKSVSVTAEKWIRVEEVKADSLVEYVVEMKEKGFRVIGAEQTVRSEPLNKTKFPRRCLLVLGNEKKGIPPNLIPLLDVCVEIPQAGIIRSLNVHVTGALFLWEYAKQNLFLARED